MRRGAGLAASAAAAVAVAVMACPAPARAHHGVAAVGAAGVEGPGAALDTTAALPLAQGAALLLAKTELVEFRTRAVDGPQKDYSSFTTLLAGYGVRPWLTAYLLQPYSVKAQEVVGRSAGFADPSVMLALSFKYDGGLRLAPEKESLDDLEDWHFQLWASSSLPLGSTSARDRAGDFFEPDMQSGFGDPSFAAGLAALKQLTPDITWLGEAGRQQFLAHDYRGVRYRFGGETRLNTALAWRALARGATRVDLVGELNGLHLQRDREEAEGGGLEALRASGGAILYGGGGVRLQLGRVGATLGVKRALLSDLNEASEQQGSEGLERFRASASIAIALGP